MKVLITGHQGYLGAVLVPLLMATGHEVHGYDCDLYKDCDFGAPPPTIPGFCKDVRDATADNLAGFEAVIHLAALSNDPLGSLDPRWTMAINYEATLQLARLARQAGVRRFIFSSSCSMYGSGGSRPVDESAPLRPLTAYARSKVLSEEGLSKLADDRFSPVFMRNATVYGVSPRLRVDIVLNNLVAWAHTSGEVRILSDGTPWRPLIHVQDIATAFLAALQAPREAIHNTAFNVGGDSENYQVRDLAEVTASVLPGSRITYGDQGGDPRDYRVNFSRILQRLNFRPQWDVRRGAHELSQAYQRQGLAFNTFRSNRFTRLDRIRALLERGILGKDLRLNPARAPTLS